jgi:protein-S-isoprenylcysteine O-methyltransferase Ste14
MKTRKPLSYFLLFLAAFIGGGGLLIFMLFLFRGPFNIVDLGLTNIQVLFFDAFLCLVFFAQHSLMARKPFRQWLKTFLPTSYYGAFYAVASGIALLALVILWQESALLIFTVQGFVRLLYRGVFVLAIAGVAWTVFSLGFLVNFRVQPMVDDLRGKQSVSSLVIDRGPYRWVRHPLYLSSILMIWSNPDLTLDRLLFNLIFTTWVVIAILLEERGLIGTFGEGYRRYQQEVPMLIPWRFPKKYISRARNLSIKLDNQ